MTNTAIFVSMASAGLKPLFDHVRRGNAVAEKKPQSQKRLIPPLFDNNLPAADTVFLVLPHPERNISTASGSAKAVVLSHWDAVSRIAITNRFLPGLR
jgi:hypothetical protein